MNTGDEKYAKIIKALRHQEPDNFTLSEIEETVLNSISEKGRAYPVKQNVIDFIFGWIWIGWVRRSLITASLCLVIFFVWQQNSILTKIDRLQMQIRQNDRMITYNPSLTLEKKVLLKRLSEEENLNEKIIIDKSDLEQLLDSLERMQSRYSKIIKLIENDPALKKSVEQQLRKNMVNGQNL